MWGGKVRWHSEDVLVLHALHSIWSIWLKDYFCLKVCLLPHTISGLSSSDSCPAHPCTYSPCVSCLELPLCRATNSQPEQTLAVSSLWKSDVRSGLGCWLPIPDPLWGCVPGENILISIVQFITFLACRILRRLMWRLKWYSQETSRTRRCRKHAPKQWFSAFLRLQPFTTVPRIVVTPTRKLFRHFS